MAWLFCYFYSVGFHCCSHGIYCGKGHFLRITILSRLTSLSRPGGLYFLPGIEYSLLQTIRNPLLLQHETDDGWARITGFCIKLHIQ